MSTVYANEMPSEVSIFRRREIEPLLVKARQVLKCYDKAMNCSAIVLDRSGQEIKTLENKKEMRFCELCKKYRHNPSAIWEGYKYPCEKLHCNALVESRRNNGTYIYTCATGFIYWTSPLYRNGRYAGALTAGQVLSCSHEEAVEKFHALSKDRLAAEKFRKALEPLTTKSLDEIQAMARLLGICAEEISEKDRGTDLMIRRLILKEVGQKKLRPALKAPPKKDQAKSDRPKNDLSNADTGPEKILEKERILVAAFRRGDSEAGSRILNELMNLTIAMFPENSNEEDLEIIRLRAIELLVLLSRAAVADNFGQKGTGGYNLSDTNDRYLKRIQESKTTEELVENLLLAARSLEGKIFSFQGIRHASVLRKAERYIWDNYNRKLSLAEISKASGLSAPYLSTVFK